MTRCSHFTYEQVLSAHNLPLLHLVGRQEFWYFFLFCIL
ncbi:hypothetical protein E2C01_093531 [Portunus trituberculatus]|uniref:Uncharacterized protein n=1 Tax=Portunus trituberculatus TaxID=210409 RepID=A0A5B7JYI2_PORTR|nr:hypothetical protein [Portunus trituberculatus]